MIINQTSGGGGGSGTQKTIIGVPLSQDTNAVVFPTLVLGIPIKIE